MLVCIIARRHMILQNAFDPPAVDSTHSSARLTGLDHEAHSRPCLLAHEMVVHGRGHEERGGLGLAHRPQQGDRGPGHVGVAVAQRAAEDGHEVRVAGPAEDVEGGDAAPAPALAAMALRSAGYRARNYPGSWHEWSRHDDLPIER